MESLFRQTALLLGFSLLSWISYSPLTHAQARFIDDFLVDLNEPGDMTWGPQGELYVVSRNKVLKISGSTGRLLEGFTQLTEPDRPTSLSFGPNNDLYISSEGSNKILRHDGTTGHFKEVFVQGDSLFSPHGITFGPEGHLYVASETQVLRYDGRTGNSLGVFAQREDSTRFTELVFGPDNHLYVISTFAGTQVLRFDGTSGELIDIFTEERGIGGHTGIAFGPEGNLYLANKYQNVVQRYDGTNGAFLDTVVSDSTQLESPNDIVFDTAGRLYVSNSNRHEIPRYSLEKGERIDVYTKGSALFNPLDIAFGPDGHLYVVSAIGQLLRFDGKTGVFLDNFTDREEADGIWSLTFGPENDLFVTSLNNDRVIRYDGVTGELKNILIDGLGIDGPRNLAFGPDGNVYVTSAVGNRVVRYKANTGAYIDTWWAYRAEDLLFSEDGFLYVVSRGDNWVMWLDVDRRILIGAAGQEGNIQNPTHIAFGPQGDLYVSDDEKVVRYNRKTAAFIEIYAYANGIQDPAGITFGPDGNLYVASLNNHKVLRFEGPGETTSTTSSAEELPASIASLRPAFPNPFSKTTTFQFDVQEPSPVRISVYNTYGQLVEVLVDRFMPAGSHQVEWAPTVSGSGVYYYRIESQHFTTSRRVLYVK